MVSDQTRADMAVDHIGVDLWQAFRAYETRMFAALASGDHTDVTLTDSGVLAYVGPDGARSADIAKARQITKQAAQEQAQRLVRKGYLTIGPDPADGRAKRLMLTARGEALMAELATIKRSLHCEVAGLLGNDKARALRDSLSAIQNGLRIPSR